MMILIHGGVCSTSKENPCQCPKYKRDDIEFGYQPNGLVIPLHLHLYDDSIFTDKYDIKYVFNDTEYELEGLKELGEELGKLEFSKIIITRKLNSKPKVKLLESDERFDTIDDYKYSIQLEDDCLFKIYVNVDRSGWILKPEGKSNNCWIQSK